MTREHEYEVLKRHDVYVVRKVGTEFYAARFGGVDPIGGFYRFWGISGDKSRVFEFSFKWRAILHAKSLEREAKSAQKYDALIDARKSATKERVWR